MMPSAGSAEFSALSGSKTWAAGGREGGITETLKGMRPLIQCVHCSQWLQWFHGGFAFLHHLGYNRGGWRRQ